MKLFTKEVDKQLFAQYPKGSDLDNQMVVAKIFNPYGRGVWYLLNSDPEDPDYIWAIVDLFEPEMGSVSRSELQTIKVPPFGLGLERDIYFTPKPAKEVFEGVLSGKRYAAGGMTPGRYYTDNSGNELRYVGESQGKLLFKDGEKIVSKSEEDFEDRPKETKLFGFFEKGGEIAKENNEMLQSNIVELKHHADELDKIVTNKTEVEPWVIAKTERASTDLSDVTHYLDGEKKKGLKMPFEKGGYMARGGEVTPYIVWVSKDGEMRELYGEYKSKRAADIKMNKLWESGEYKQMGNKPKSMYQKEGFYADGGRVKGKNNETGETYGVVIGSVQKSDENIEGGTEMNVRTSYSSRISEDQLIFDKNGNLYEITDFGYALEGKYPDTSRGSGHRYNADKKETLQILSKKYNPSFAKRLIELAKDSKMAHGGQTKGKRYKVNVYYGGEMEDEEVYTDSLEQAKRISQGGEHSEIYDNEKKEFVEIEYADGGETEDGVDLFEDYDEIPDNVQEILQKYDFEEGDYRTLKKAKKDVETVGYTFEYSLDGTAYDLRKIGQKGKSEDEDEYAKGGKLVGKQKNLDVNKNGKLDAEDFKILRGEKMAKGGEVDKPKTITFGELKQGEEYYQIDNTHYQIKKYKITEKRPNGYSMIQIGGANIGEQNKDGAIKSISKYQGAAYSSNEDVYLYKTKEDAKKSYKIAFLDALEKMAMGGKVKFEDKVKSIKASLLKRKKVSPKVQKDYGKTYSPKEAEESAKRIAASQRMKYELKKKFKKGGKTIAQTPAPKKDRVFGSSTNKAGSASSKKTASNIELNESIVKTLGEKAKEYNEKHSSKVSTSTLKAVMRRGMGAFSTSHRPGMTRQGWGYARVNKFLKKKGGAQVKAAYVQDDDLL